MPRLPASLRDVLEDAPPLVVGPVGAGFGQESLEEWALGDGRQVVRDPAELAGGPALLLPARRSRIAAVPRHLPLDDLLVLQEADLLLDADDWAGELAGAAPRFVEESFRQSEGWPAGLELSSRAAPTGTPLHQHPLAAIYLERLLPGDELREAVGRAALTPLLVPELHELLELGTDRVAELLDRGLLFGSGQGLTMPKLLRRYLQPHPDARVAQAVAEVLARGGNLEPALLALAEAEQWVTYLETLAANFEPRPAEGEARLRRALEPVPSALRRNSAWLYLVGTLDRLCGDYDRAQERYRTARRGVAGEPASDSRGDSIARIDNGRGIAFALAGKLEQAKRAFGSAIRHGTSDRLEGEARHNRAGVYIQQGRYADAESDLRKAIASFRAGGDFVREARSVQLLALSWHQRGLLREARRGYEEALDLLATLGQPSALLRTNLAEVLLLAGERAQANEQLDQAAAETRLDTRARGYIETNRAMCLLAEGEARAAARRLEALLRGDGLDARLRAEAQLLLARALRQQGDRDGALEYARQAESLGVPASLEIALCGGGDLDSVIGRARDEEARFDLAAALLHRGSPSDLREALDLIRTHGYGCLLDSPQYAPVLAALVQEDPAASQLFPLRIATFGTLRVRFLGRTLTLADFPTRKSAALLLRLALSSRPVPREALAEEFWSHAGNQVQSLQTGLYHLNRTLGAQVIASSRGMVELAYPVRLDLEEFERSATEALGGAALRNLEVMRQAIALVEGDALAEFPEWFDDERRRIEGLLVRLWRRLAECEEARPRRSAEALEALLRIDPYDVESRRDLIETYRQIGDLELVRRHREALRELESEL
ncbi:MAG TPA: hypothetical protein VF168_06255 [Trueperaceae bacterium]